MTTTIVSTPVSTLASKRRFRIAIPVPGDNTREIELCQCTTMESLASVISALMGPFSGGPTIVKVEVFYGE